VTEASESASADPQDVLQAVARAAGHELRNALNGLVVNLEVVRARTAAARVSAEPFMGQAVAQSEESIRLAEAVITLMLTVAKSLSGSATIALNDPKKEARIEAGNESERLEKALAPLVARRLVSIETHGSTVILRIPEDSPE
jgi:signal transduction histidine kinase